MSEQDGRPVGKVELLHLELDTWEGRRDFAEQQIERIKQELGVIATRKGFHLIQGGKDAE